MSSPDFEAGEIALAALKKLDDVTTTSPANWKEPSFRRKVRLIINEAKHEIALVNSVKP
jgi:hypothetical protein